MKYILIDSNILLDIIAFRTKESPLMTYNLLRKLLEYKEDTIRLIVPAVAVQETIRYSEKIFMEMESRLSDIEAALQKGYWINLNEADTAKFKNDINNMADQFQGYQNKLKAEKNSYKEVLTKKIMTIIEHPHTIKIATNDALLSKAYKRQIYKRCPFDRKTNALSDALIVEILINIKDFISSFSAEDKVYFITRNTSDFSEPGENKEILHRHIVKDLQEGGLGDAVVYRTRFYQMIKNDFSEEILSASGMELDLENEIKMEFARQEWESEKICAQ